MSVILPFDAMWYHIPEDSESKLKAYSSLWYAWEALDIHDIGTEVNSLNYSLVGLIMSVYS